MHKVQKMYTLEFKRETVRLAQSSGKPITQVARELGISDSNAQARRCSYKATSTPMKKHVAANVATPKHTQDTQEYLIYNHKKEEPNKTQ